MLHQKSSEEIPRIFYPSRRLDISSDFSLYLITEGAYHHALACIHLRLDEIQHFVLMIYNFFKIDDIRATGMIGHSSSIIVKHAPPNNLGRHAAEIVSYTRFSFRSFLFDFHASLLFSIPKSTSPKNTFRMGVFRCFSYTFLPLSQTNKKRQEVIPCLFRSY